MKAKYPRPEDWCKVRFPDNVHFSFGPQGRVCILRQPGEGDCPDCVQEQEKKTRKKKSKRKREGEDKEEVKDLEYKLYA